MPRRHTARPRLELVVDNSSRIAGLRSQEVLGQSDVFHLRHFGYRTAEFPRNAVGLPLVYGLSVNVFTRSLAYPSGDGRAVPQFFYKTRVFLHDRPIVREFFGFVNTDNSDDPKWRRIDTRGMANKKSKSPDAVAIGRRLLWLRGAVGYPARRDYAKFLSQRTTEDWETWEDRLEKYEDGSTQAPLTMVRLARQLHGIPYEWVFDEEWGQVPNDLYIALKDYEKNVG